MNKYIAIIVSLSFLLNGCAKSIPEAKTITFNLNDGKIDLSDVLPNNWDKVCIITPYSTNAIAKDTLGVNVDITGSSKIDTSDSISLLVTMMKDEVVQLFEVPVSNIFFASLGTGCYLRGDAIFSVSETGITHDKNT